MQKLLHLTLLLAVIASFTACNSRDHHRKIVRNYLLEEQQMTPSKVDAATTLMSVEMEGDNVVYRYLIDEEMITIEALSLEKELIRAEFDIRRKHNLEIASFVNTRWRN